MAIYNITVRVPKRGDIVVIDAEKDYQFIALETFSALALPSGWQAVGAVARVWGRRCLCIHKTSASQKWAEKFLWRLTGYTLDGTDRAVSITANGATCSVTYNATDLSTLASQLDAAVRPFDFGGHSYSVYVRDGELILQHDTYTTYVAVSATGVSVSARVAPELTADSRMERYNGARSGEGPVMNLDRALIYFSGDLSSTAYNPSSDVASIATTYPVCLPAYLGTSQYQSDHCALLRSRYGEGREGWMKYMKRQMIINPSAFGAMTQDGRENTYKLAGQTYTDRDGGGQLPLYPASDYAAAVEYGCDGLRKGDWFLPSIADVADIMAGITYPAVYDEETGASEAVSRADSDPLNRALYAIGGTAIGNGSSVWSSCRYSTSGAWNYHGSGFANRYSFYGTYLAVPSVLLDLA